MTAPAAFSVDGIRRRAYLPVMATEADSTNARADAVSPSPIGRRRPPSPAEQARRVAWGKQAGAKVAAAYRELTKEQ